MLKTICAMSMAAAVLLLLNPVHALAASAPKAAEDTSKANAPATFWDVKANKAINSTDLAGRLAGVHKVIMFGEYHDQTAVHQAQQKLYQELTSINKTPVVLSMEMFERDTQKNMDAYLTGKMSEADMLKSSRPWSNYKEDYRPMVENAKKHGYYVLCSNIPRFMASTYAKKGTVDEYNPAYYAKHTYAPEGAYKDRFIQVMKANAASGMKIPPMMYNAMYRAQCIKDDTMAESIDTYLKKNPDSLIFHIQGDFHGSYHLGVAQKLAALDPKLFITVISPVARQKGKAPQSLAKANSTIGYYILFFDRVEKTGYTGKPAK